MTEKKPTQKDLWKAIVLEFLHNCFIGISHLTCSEENCPLVYHWDTIEEKNSKKGKCAFYLVSKKDNQFLVVDLTDSEENDLGTIENIEIKFKSGKTQRTKPKNEENKTLAIKNSGWQEETKDKKEIFLKEEELVCFFNNPSHTSNLVGAEEVYLEDLWETKQKIKWDQDKSKKKVFLFCENEPGEDSQAKKIDASEKDYLFYISDPSITNSIKDYEVYSPSQGKEERKQLWTDYKEELSELKELFGIRHNTQEKEDRQNNPEISLLQSPFLSLERRKKRIREESIREFENKKFCKGNHTLSYGSIQDHQQELELAEEVQSEQKEEAKEEKPTEINQKEQNKENFVLISKEK